MVERKKEEADFH